MPKKVIDNDEGDLLDSLLNDELDDLNDDLDEVPTNEDVKDLKDQIDTLNKENHGLLQGVKKERAKRQEISGQLNQLTTTVNSILEQRNAAEDILKNAAAGSPTSRGIPVQYGDDGEAYVDPKSLESIVTPYQQKINQLEQDLQISNADAAASMEADKVKNAIIGEDERYYLANSKYQAARKWVVDQVIDFSRQNGINHTITSGQALDFVFDDELENEFNQHFEGVDLVDVVTAEDSQHHFRQMLNNIAEAVNPMIDDSRPESKIDSRFQKVLNKPSNLGNQANAKAGALSISEKMSQLKTEDILNLTDAQAAALEKALLEEETTDGVIF